MIVCNRPCWLYVRVGLDVCAVVQDSSIFSVDARLCRQRVQAAKDPRRVHSMLSSVVSCNTHLSAATSVVDCHNRR